MRAILSNREGPSRQQLRANILQSTQNTYLDAWTLREHATQELEKLGVLAELGLRRALADQPSAEVRKRLEELLDKLAGRPIRCGEWLGVLRAIEVLERIGTPEARRVLATLARGVPEARPT